MQGGAAGPTHIYPLKMGQSHVPRWPAPGGAVETPTLPPRPNVSQEAPGSHHGTFFPRYPPNILQQEIL